MIDVHNHLLYGIDDGSQTIEESVEIINHLSSIGIKNVIFTPHYIVDSRYSSPRKHNLSILKELQRNIAGVNFYLGNEIYIDENIKELLSEGLISSLNNTKYLLIELPMDGVFEGYEDIFQDLLSNGYKVVLAHPERYGTIQRDFDILYTLKDMGVIFQSNIRSLVHDYGSHAEKTAERMIKEHLVTYMGTDIHHSVDYNFLEEAKKKMRKYISEEEMNAILSDNAYSTLLC